jgi:hypothetical protein
VCVGGGTTGCVCFSMCSTCALVRLCACAPVRVRVQATGRTGGGSEGGLAAAVSPTDLDAKEAVYDTSHLAGLGPAAALLAITRLKSGRGAGASGGGADAGDGVSLTYSQVQPCAHTREFTH